MFSLLFLLLWFLLSVRNGSFDLLCVVINVVYFDFVIIVDTDLNNGTICAWKKWTKTKQDVLMLTWSVMVMMYWQKYALSHQNLSYHNFLNNFIFGLLYSLTTYFILNLIECNSHWRFVFVETKKKNYIWKKTWQFEPVMCPSPSFCHDILINHSLDIFFHPLIISNIPPLLSVSLFDTTGTSKQYIHL